MSDFLDTGNTVPIVPAPDFPPPNYRDKANAYLQEFLGNGWWTQMLAAIANGLVAAVITVIGWMQKLVDDIVIALAQLAIAAEGQNSPEFIQLESTVLALIFGVEVDAGKLVEAGADRGPSAAMDAVGASFVTMLQGLLTTKGATSTGLTGGDIPSGGAGNVYGQNLPAGAGMDAAARMIGFRIASEMRAENAGMLLELGSFGFLKPFADLIERMQGAVPMSRIIGRAIAPLTKVLISDPMTGELNARYRPTPLAPAEAVRAFTRGLMDAGDLADQLARHGYSDEAQQVLLLMNQSHPTLGDVEVAYRAGLLANDTELKSWTNLGYTHDDAVTLQQLARVKQTNSYVSQYVGEILTLWRSNFMTIDVVNKLIEPLPIFDEEKDWIRKIGGLYNDTHTKRLSLSEMESAVDQAVIDINAFEQWARDEGYTPDSVKVLELLELLKLKAQQDKDAAAAAKAKATADAAAAKAAAAVAQNNALSGGTGGKPLTFAQWEKAYQEGIIGDDDFRAFLTAYGFAGAPLEIVFTEQQQARAAATAANAKAAQIIAAEGTTPLTLAQIEQAYLAGIMDDDELSNRLAAIGYAGDNLAILIAYEQQRLAAKKAAKVVTPPGTPPAAKPKLTQADGEAAFVAGVMSRTDYAALLAALGFAPAEVNTELALADIKVKEAAAKAAAAAAAANSVAPKELTLAQAKASVLAGTATRDDYAALLIAKGYSDDDQATLLADLDAAIAKAAAAAAAGTPTTPAAKPKTLDLSQEEALFVAGTVSADDYNLYLLKQGYSAADAALLMSLSATKKAQQTAISAISPAEGPGPGTKKLTIAQIDAAYLSGDFDLAAVQAAYQSLGLGITDRNTLQAALLVKAANKGLATAP